MVRTRGHIAVCFENSIHIHTSEEMQHIPNLWELNTNTMCPTDITATGARCSQVLPVTFLPVFLSGIVHQTLPWAPSLVS